MDTEERELELQRLQQRLSEDKEEVEKQVESIKMKERIVSSLQIKLEREKTEI